jgi:hypothetical protein
MTVKQTVLSNLTRKQRIARKRALERKDAVILANHGIVLVGVEGWKRPEPLVNPVMR